MKTIFNLAKKIKSYFSEFVNNIRTWFRPVKKQTQLELTQSTFTVEPLSEHSRQTLVDKGIWKPNCPVALERLNKVKFSYYNFQNSEEHTGEIVVLDTVAGHVAGVFKDLHAKKFPIKGARPIEEYNGNDDASMADDNSVCFNYREITGGGLPSIHSYGLAIDVNPIENPYLGFGKTEAEKGQAKVLPPLGWSYVNRANAKPGMVEPIVPLFKQHGFKVWGGNWTTPIDWQHFQPSRAMAQLLAEMSCEHGKVFFESYIKGSKLLDNITPENNQLVSLYKTNANDFMSTFTAQPDLFDKDPEIVYELLTKDKAKPIRLSA